jgi:beta-glucosidase
VSISRRDVASLLVPVLRWEPGGGFADLKPFIADALELGVGGFKLVGGEQDAVRALAKEMQLKSRHPLLIAADLECGAGQQFAGATGLPPLGAIGALGDIESLRRAARLTAREARTMGVNWNLAPVADLDLLDENPTLGSRALGSDARKVGTLVTAWIEACQAEGVLACVKHFPGMGRAPVDPHMALPQIDAPADVLKDHDLVPFRAAISAGVASMMTAHGSFPAFDSSRMPATLSREIIQWMLRQQFKYDNLVVTDSMTMKAVTDARSSADAAVLAIRAGCDVILDPEDAHATADALFAAVGSGSLDADRVRQAMRRRLKWAQWASPPNDWRRPSGADTAWGSLLADRVLRVEHGPLPPIGNVTEVMIIDDDTDVLGKRPDRQALLDALRLGGTDARLVQAPGASSGGPLVIALFADNHAGKERTRLLPETSAAVANAIADAAAMQRGAIILALGDPRYVAQLGMQVPTVIAWSGDRVMQQAAARQLQRTKR